VVRPFGKKLKPYEHQLNCDIILLNMAVTKSQHFVPKFYLRNFSIENNGKSLSLWVIKDNRYIERGSLADQACRNFFYGQEMTVETALGEIETHAAPIIKTIISKHILPSQYSEQHLILLSFIVSLSLRTKFQADEVNESGDQLFKAAYKEHPDLKDNIDRFFIHTDGAPLLALGSLESAIKLSFDLKYKLLINTTKAAFVTSDNPVIKHNQYLIEDKQMGHLGFASTGLQIIIPLSPSVCLIFYDQKTYKVGNKRDSSVFISNPTDIDVINEFQYINADEVVYFNEKVNDKYLEWLTHEASHYRRNSKSVLNEYKVSPLKPDTKRAILHIRPSSIEKNLLLSPIKVLTRARGNLRTANFELSRNPILASKILNEEEEKIRQRAKLRSEKQDIESSNIT
jgi:hypothetical protein